MARKKKLYLVWQSTGSYDTYNNNLCGIFDNEEDALELKAKLDKRVVSDDECWNIVPQDVFDRWGVFDTTDMEFCDFDYVDEFEGYTREQRDLQEDRWVMMANGYSVASIEEVYMNEELNPEF